MPAQKTNINLLEHDEFSTSLLGRILTWALSVGRYIIVITELVVIVSFLSRFKLDRDLVNLEKEIVNEKAIIESYGDLPDRFRYLQAQLRFIKEKKSGVMTESLIDSVVASVPIEVKLEQMQLTSQGIQLKALSLNQEGFAKFVQALRSQPQISQITVSKLSVNEQGSVLEFDLLASTKQIEKRESVSNPKVNNSADSEELEL